MEKDINVADILKDKPANTRLYSPLFGYVYLLRLSNNIVEVSHHGEPSQFYNNARYFNYHESEPLLFPSKEMRDWSKFAWKKGDVLSCGVDNLSIFEKWANEEYTEFYAKFVTPNYSGNTFKTEKWSKETNEAVIKQYISNIEKFKGGKLNLATLEIEKQPEFKDGDILCISGMGYLAYGIVKSIDNSSKKLEYYVLNDMSTLKFEDWLSFEDKQIQPITETQQIILFDALAKKGKRWDAEKKKVVDLPKKCEFKPFDKVLCRNSKDDTWEVDFFARLTRKEVDYIQSDKYLCVGQLWMYCIPYNEETAHLIGTTDEWKRGK